MVDGKYKGVYLWEIKSKKRKELKKDIQIVFQDPYGSLSPRMTIGEIVGEGLGVHFKLSQKEKENKKSLYNIRNTLDNNFSQIGDYIFDTNKISYFGILPNFDKVKLASDHKPVILINNKNLIYINN